MVLNATCYSIKTASLRLYIQLPQVLIIRALARHSLLQDMGLATYESATDAECLDAFMALSRLEGIILPETAHAIAYAMRVAKTSPDETILVNLSGRGDKDIDFILDKVVWGKWQ